MLTGSRSIASGNVDVRCLPQRDCPDGVEQALTCWDYANPEAAVVGVGFHALERTHVRMVPLALIGVIVRSLLTRNKAENCLLS